MHTANLLIVLGAMIVAAYYLARSRSLVQARPLGGIRHLHSLPFFYGLRASIWCGVPSLALLALWLMFDDVIVSNVVLGGLPEHLQPTSISEENLTLGTIRNLASGALSGAAADPALVAASERLVELRSIGSRIAAAAVLSLALLGGLLAWLKMSPQLRARQQVEAVFKGILLLCSLVAIFTTLGILLSVLFESLRFFQAVPITEFLFGTHWSPQTAIRVDQVGSSGSFGAVPLFLGTLLISFIAMVVAVPVGLMSAIYLAEYASRRVRAF